MIIFSNFCGGWNLNLLSGSAAGWRNRLRRRLLYSTTDWVYAADPRSNLLGGKKKTLRRSYAASKREKVLYVIHTITCFIHQCTTLFWDACVRTLACAVRMCAIKSVCLWVQGTLKAGMKTLLPPRGNSIVTTQSQKHSWPSGPLYDHEYTGSAPYIHLTQ